MNATEALRRMDEITAYYKARDPVYEQAGRLFWRSWCDQCGRLLEVWPLNDLETAPSRVRCECGMPYVLMMNG